jgi:hypothetical protein
MNERDKELAKQAWTENDWDGHVDIPKLIQLVRADTMEAATRAANQSWMLLAKAMIAAEREACAEVADHMASRCNDIRAAALESAAENIRARGNT